MPNRQLAAIMFTDIVGYTAMMAKNETETLELRRKNREIHQEIINTYNGKWLKEMGDGTMASFTTLSDAVQCAINIEKKCRTKLGISLKVGIHMGEVVIENEDIFGDGINIAARIHELANHGGILVSEVVYNELKNKTDFNIRFIGETRLKNIETPAKIYQIWEEGAGRSTVKLPGKKFNKSIIIIIALSILTVASYFLYKNFYNAKRTFNNSIAVLPFKSLSANADDQNYADGMMDLLLGDLAKIKDIDKVISRTSTEQYRNTTKTIPQIADELGVSYIVEATVQKSEDTIRVTIQLINSGDQHVWSNTYDRKLNDLFGVQTEIAKTLAKALAVNLTQNEIEALEEVPTRNMEAYDLYLKALRYGTQYDATADSLDYKNAMKFSRMAFSLDSTFVEPLILMGYVFTENSRFNNNTIYLDSAERLLKQAVKLDSKKEESFIRLGDVYYWKALLAQSLGDTTAFRVEYKKAKENYETGINLVPGSPERYRRRAFLYNLSGKIDSTAFFMKKFVEIDPRNPAAYWQTGFPFLSLEMYERAKAYFLESIDMAPDELSANFGLLYIFIRTGKYKEFLEQAKTMYAIKQDDDNLFTLINGYRLTGNFKKAEELASEEIEKEKYTNNIPGNPIFLEYAIILDKRGEHQRAVQYIKKQIILSKKKNQVNNLAMVYSYLNKKDSAHFYLNKSFARDSFFYWRLNDPIYDSIRNDQQVVELVRKEREPVLLMRRNFERMEAQDELERVKGN